MADALDEAILPMSMMTKSASPVCGRALVFTTLSVAPALVIPWTGCFPAGPVLRFARKLQGRWFGPWDDEGGFDGLAVGIVTPVGLHEDGVDLAEADGFDLVANGFDEGSEAEVFDGSQGAFGAASNEVESFFGEGGVWESDAVELGEDEAFELVVVEGVEFGAVGDPGFEIAVDAQLQGGVELGLAD